MITKIYTCDRCKATDETNKIGLCKVTVTTSSVFSISRSREAEWCEKCTNELGLIKTMPEIKRIESLTIEALIKEIVRKELQ